MLKTKTRIQYEISQKDPVGVYDFFHKGVQCFLIRRDKLHTWCGYVVLPEGHPWRYEEVDNAVKVHGGITYKGEISELPGRYVLGFNATHHGDFFPLVYETGAEFLAYGAWRDKEYMEAECKKLASAVLKKMEEKTVANLIKPDAEKDWFYLELSKREAVEVIAFLVSQLGDTPLPGNQAGACPTLRVRYKDTNHLVSLIVSNK